MSTPASQRVSALIKLSLSTSLGSCLAVRQGSRCQFGQDRTGREQQSLSSLHYTLFSLDEAFSLLYAAGWTQTVGPVVSNFIGRAVDTASVIENLLPPARRP